jgi:hypothetical protein
LLNIEPFDVVSKVLRTHLRLARFAGFGIAELVCKPDIGA